MINHIRQAYNQSFSEEKYQQFLEEISRAHNHVPPFRISESPVFVGKDLKSKILQACDEICEVLCADDFRQKSANALRPEYTVPNEPDHNVFLQLDFGICELDDGTLEPKLIELQGFPTLYFYQDLVARMYRKYFDVPDTVTHLFGGLDSDQYIKLLRKVIVGDADPKNTVLLEIEPEKQPTQIDYWATRDILGIKVLCVSEVIKEGNDAYYIDENGDKVRIERIYNRVIFDELVGRKDIQRQFYFTEEVNAHWVGHPNWFFRISKNTLELLDSKYVPKTIRLSNFSGSPSDLEQFVLKPLYSFSGAGVIFNVKEAHLQAIKNPENFILQEKVSYSPVISSPDGMVKCEIRMLMIWEENELKPRLVNNLARMSKGEMIGVKYNRNKTWVGGSVGFFEK